MNNEAVEVGKAEDFTNADSKAYTSDGTDSQNIGWVGKNSSGWKLLLTNVILNVPSGAISLI